MSYSENISSTQSKRRLLLIAYYYYQEESPASKRTKGLVHYLPAMGWDVTLLTLPQDKNQQNTANIIHAEEDLNFIQKFASRLSKSNNLNASHNSSADSKYTEGFAISLGKWILDNKYLRNITRKIYRILFHKSSYDGYEWFSSAVEVGRTALSKEKYDAILSTQCPISAHCVGRKLKQEFGLPWIADYRDLWSQWDLMQKRKSTSQREKEYQFECELIRTADVLTVVSEPWAVELKEQHHKPVFVIPNGYDPAILNPGKKLDEKFSILHSGVIYGRKRSPEYLYRAIRELIDEGTIDIDDISLDFYGPVEEGFEEDVYKYSLKECVNFHGLIPHQTLLEYQRQAQILLLLTADDPIDVGCYPAKVFEYLAASRPILSYGYPKECVLSKLLSETSTGYHVLTYDAVKEKLKEWYGEWKEDGMVLYQGNMLEVEKYSHQGMARKFKSVLEETINKYNCLAGQ